MRYQETVWSNLYPGNRPTVSCVQAAAHGTQRSLELDAAQRQRTVWRMDGGAGSDDNFRWLLAQGYHVHAKGLSHRRAGAFAQRVERWDGYGDIWLGEIASPFTFAKPVRVFVQRRLKNERFVHSYYLSSLTLPSKGAFLHFYDLRGGAEVEQFRADKMGLAMGIRRKRSFTGQAAYILLTDLAPNLLADFKHRALPDSRFATFGLKRIVRDLLHMPGRLVFEGPRLTRIELLTQNQFAPHLLVCLQRLISDD